MEELDYKEAGKAGLERRRKGMRGIMGVVALEVACQQVEAQFCVLKSC